MNVRGAALLAEILGGTGVVVCLLFVGLQVRDGASAQEALVGTEGASWAGIVTKHACWQAEAAPVHLRRTTSPPGAKPVGSITDAVALRSTPGDLSALRRRVKVPIGRSRLASAGEVASER